MKFTNPQLNYLFILLGCLFLLDSFAYKRKIALSKRFARPQLLSAIALTFSAKRQWEKRAFILMAIFLSILALLRPQWGFQWEQVKQGGVDIFIAVDVSKSMLSQDTLPNRLERAKLSLEDLVKNLRQDRIGLIAFSGSAFVQCPLTVDYEGFLLAAKDLNIKTIPKGGTNIERAIDLARESFIAGSEGTQRALIIISDGESHEGNPILAAEKAKKENIKIYTIGAGTKEGELIRVFDEQGNQIFLKDQTGQVVKSRLNEDLLQEIALKSEGSYIHSTATQFGLDTIYENKIAKTQARQIKSNREKRLKERFQIPLALALLLIMIEPLVAEQRRQ